MIWTYHEEFTNREVTSWPHYIDSSGQYLLIHRHEWYKDFLLIDKDRNMYRFKLADVWDYNDFDDWLAYADYLIENNLLVPEAQALALWPREELDYEIPTYNIDGGTFHRVNRSDSTTT